MRSDPQPLFHFVLLPSFNAKWGKWECNLADRHKARNRTLIVSDFCIAIVCEAWHSCVPYHMRRMTPFQSLRFLIVLSCGYSYSEPLSKSPSSILDSALITETRITRLYLSWHLASSHWALTWTACEDKKCFFSILVFITFFVTYSAQCGLKNLQSFEYRE